MWRELVTIILLDKKPSECDYTEGTGSSLAHANFFEDEPGVKLRPVMIANFTSLS